MHNILQFIIYPLGALAWLYSCIIWGKNASNRKKNAPYLSNWKRALVFSIVSGIIFIFMAICLIALFVG